MFIISRFVISMDIRSSTSTHIFLILLSYGIPYLIILYLVLHWVLLSMLCIPILSIMYINISRVYFVVVLVWLHIHLSPSYLWTQLYSSRIQQIFYRKKKCEKRLVCTCCALCRSVKKSFVWSDRRENWHTWKPRMTTPTRSTSMKRLAGLSLVPASQFVVRVSQLFTFPLSFAFPFPIVLGLVAITTTHCTVHASTRALAWHSLI